MIAFFYFKLTLFNSNILFTFAYHLILILMKNIHRLNRNIYITNEQEIKVKDWYINMETNMLVESKNVMDCNSYIKKIISTTDQDLINEGVFSIDNKTLELLANNPTCIYANIEPLMSNNGRALFGYNLSIPEEE